MNPDGWELVNDLATIMSVALGAGALLGWALAYPARWILTYRRSRR